MFATGLEDAVLDLSAVVDQAVLGKLVPERSRVLFGGISRGGFLSLVMAARRPDLASGVISFVGGWFSMRDDYPPELNQRRQRLQADELARLGRVVRVPTLWIHAARDPTYSDTTTRRLFQAFRTGGGDGEYVFVSEHHLESGHHVADDLGLWEQAADAFLTRVR